MGDMMSVDQTYTAAQIAKAGGIRYAPVTTSVDGVEVFNGAKFWGAHASRILAINGLDTQTNNHDAGSRTVWSGQLAEGYPSFAALVAAVASESLSLSMPFVSNGGYDATQGLVPLARIGFQHRRRAEDRLHRRVQPDERDVGRLLQQGDRVAHRGGAAGAPPGRAEGGDACRWSETAAGDSLPRPRRQAGLGALAAQLTARSSSPRRLPRPRAYHGHRPAGQLLSLMQQIQIALLAFKAGAAVSVNLNIGSFDTTRTTTRHSAMMVQLLRGLDYLFPPSSTPRGSTPRPTCSSAPTSPARPTTTPKRQGPLEPHELPRRPGRQHRRQGTIGGTDPNQGPLTFNAKTLAPDSGGERIGTNHLNIALRKLANIDTSAPASSSSRSTATRSPFG